MCDREKADMKQALLRQREMEGQEGELPELTQ